MGVISIFFASFGGIVVLLLLKVWELKRGAKPFSLLRYRLDLLVRSVGIKIRYYVRFVNTRTLRITLAFIVAKTSEFLFRIVSKIKNSKIFLLVMGKILPKGGGGTVSAFLKDVAEFKRDSENGDKTSNGKPPIN